MAIGIPIKMVVLTIVGMAGLAAMLGIIDNGQSAIPKSMHADVDSGNLILLSAINDSDSIDVIVEVINSIDGTPIRKASAVLSGEGTSAVNVTDENGITKLRFKKSDFEMESGEGYLDLDVKANGFRDYTNEYAVKLVR
ncbi:MAG: hypothetical protein OIN87_05680 [Candidatus Methanoperedens sp.]|nr:hypothetical protein [Candidatus Methanoperedens sp.]